VLYDGGVGTTSAGGTSSSFQRVESVLMNEMTA
jgi:hypothetical protein